MVCAWIILIANGETFKCGNFYISWRCCKEYLCYLLPGHNLNFEGPNFNLGAILGYRTFTLTHKKLPTDLFSFMLACQVFINFVYVIHFFNHAKSFFNIKDICDRAIAHCVQSLISICVSSDRLRSNPCMSRNTNNHLRRGVRTQYYVYSNIKQGFDKNGFDNCTYFI